jgi:hypothetical protein
MREGGRELEVVSDYRVKRGQTEPAIYKVTATTKQHMLAVMSDEWWSETLAFDFESGTAVGSYVGHMVGPATGSWLMFCR